MKDIEYPDPKKFSRHLLEYQTRSRQLPKELLELQDYLKQLNAYVEKYNRIKDNLARQNIGVASVSENEGKWWKKKDFPYREMGFSVKEKIGESSPVQIIEMTPLEEVIVISGNEKRGKSEDEDEKELSSILSNPVGKTRLDLDSDDSEIGIYFIEHVKPVNFVNVLQRELSTLGKIFPNVNDIIKQITHEFEHFKVCHKCLDKVSPLLPDILKELQELIKFVKKKRREKYVWPDDSDYLRKTSEALSKPFEKQVKEVERKKIRHETVGFLTVHTNTPEIIKECEANVKGEHRASEQSEHIRKCSMRVSNKQQLTVLQSKTKSDLTHSEKTQTAETEILVPKKRNGFGENSFLTEFSTSQVLKTLHPGPVFQIVLQYKVRGNIEYVVRGAESGEDQSNKFLALTDHELDREGFEKSQVLEVREFLLNAKAALRKSCRELQMESQSNSRMGNELKTGLKHLKSLMLQVHKSQIELSKVLLEKEVLNPALVQLTHPRVLREEKKGIRKAKITLSEGNLDNQRRDLQCLVDKLKSKCDMKNRLIMSLLKGLHSNVPCEKWQELVRGAMQRSDSVLQLQTEKRINFFKKSSLAFAEPENVLRCRARSACTQRESGVEEFLSERKIARATYEQGILPTRNSARISFSEIISKKSESSLNEHQMTGKESLLKAKSFTTKELDAETEKLFKDLENEVNSLTFEHNKILYEIKGLKRQKSATDQKEDNQAAASGSRTINLTIKIGDQDSISGYHSALSIVPSGATLTEKKSELSFPLNIGEVPQATAMKYSMQEFKSALNLSKEELTKRYYSARSFTSLSLKLKLPVLFKEEEAHCATKGIFRPVTEGKLENCMPLSLDSGITSVIVRKSKDSMSRCKNCSDSYLKIDLHGNRSSSEGIPDSQINNDFLSPEFPHLKPEMNVHCEQHQTMDKLRSRLRTLEDDLRSLKMTTDRMDILIEKLVDDAYESCENFKCICNFFVLHQTRSNI